MSIDVYFGGGGGGWLDNCWRFLEFDVLTSCEQ